MKVEKRVTYEIIVTMTEEEAVALKENLADLPYSETRAPFYKALVDILTKQD